MIRMRAALGILLALGVAAPASAQKARTDRIYYKDGKVFPSESSGQTIEVTRETYSIIQYEVRIRGEKVPQQVSAHKVARVEYRKVPAEFKDAMESFRNGYFEDALGGFQDLAQKGSKGWVEQYALFYAAESLFHLRRFDEALAAYEGLMKRVSDSKFIPEARFKMGECYLRKKDEVKAKAEFEGLKEFAATKGYDPIYEHKAELGLIEILEADGSFTPALSRLEALQARTAEAFPSVSSEAKLRIGNVYNHNQKYEKAESYFQAILDSGEGADPRVVYGAYLGLGDAYFSQGRFKDALKDCFLRVVVANDQRQNVEIDQLSRALFWSGRCWDQLRGEKQEYAVNAQDLYREVIRVAPGSTWAEQAKRLLRGGRGR